MGCTSEKSIPINIIEKHPDLGNSELDIDLHDIEKQGESKHPQIEEKSRRQEKSGDDVQPFLTERSSMGMCCHNRVAVEVSEDTPVLGVRQVFDDLFQFFTDTADGLVVARTEEYLDGIGQVEQLMLRAVLLNLLVDT